MIENLAKNIITRYDNLPPRKKAMVDLVSLFVFSIIGASIVVLVLYFGFWFESAMLFICYGIWGMISLLYKSRVEHYESQEKYGRK